MAKNVTPFGFESLTPENLAKAADSIKIISDSNGVTPEFGKAREMLEKAERIYFLGFGFYKKTVERLGDEWSKNFPQPKKVMGTAYHLDRTRQANAFKFSHDRLSTEAFRNQIITSSPTLFDEDVYTFLHSHVDFRT